MSTDKWLWVGIGAMLAVSIFTMVHGSEVSWSRFRGQVKAINGKTATLTIQDGKGDMLAVKVDADVIVVRGKEEVKLLSDLKMDDEVVLLYVPKAPVAKATEEQPEGGFYAPVKR